MNSLDALLEAARKRRASDLHLEAGLKPTLRIDGALEAFGEPMSGRALLDWAQQVIGADSWPEFLERRSFDATRVLGGVRCRINVLQSARGVGFAIRLLAPFRASLRRLNLHPELARFTRYPSGLVLISGSTGSGKSTTLSALLQEINGSEARHILTLESPIEYSLVPRLSFIRQREVGRDTPSFERALLDALREDPDVIAVGEMRGPEIMRHTLDAAETGHLVFATMHAADPVEVIHRLVSAFPPEIQSGVRAQLADCLRGVICQRLVKVNGVRVPECEVLVANSAVQGMLRKGDVFEIRTAIETGANDGMWSAARYRAWLQERKDFVIDDGGGDTAPEVEPAPPEPALAAPPRLARHELFEGEEPADPELGSGSGVVDDLIAKLQRSG